MCKSRVQECFYSREERPYVSLVYPQVKTMTHSHKQLDLEKVKKERDELFNTLCFMLKQFEYDYDQYDFAKQLAIEKAQNIIYKSGG